MKRAKEKEVASEERKVEMNIIVECIRWLKADTKLLYPHRDTQTISN
jgi:hypothetical protein